MQGGASHRIATGRLPVVCEGIATAMSVRAALRLLSLSASVFSAFSASNVAKVAAGIAGAWIAADNDKPIEALGNLGTGEFYAAQSGCKWTMPPELGDFNDLHMAQGLRAVALHLRGGGGGCVTPHDRIEAPCDLTGKQGPSGGWFDMTVAPDAKCSPLGGDTSKGQSERPHICRSKKKRSATSSATR